MQDFLWIDIQSEVALRNECKLAIDAANNLFQPENSKRNMVINTSTFEQALYLFKAYLQVDLWVHPCGKDFDYEYFIFAENILKELCIRGVLVISGNFVNTISYLEFAVIIDDDIVESFIDMLMKIHTMDISMIVESYKDFHMVGCCSLIHKDAESLFPSNVIQTQYVHIGMCGLHKHISDKEKQIETIASNSHTLFRVCFSSRSQLVEDILLKYWIPFNTTFGEVNKNIPHINK